MQLVPQLLRDGVVAERSAPEARWLIHNFRPLGGGLTAVTLRKATSQTGYTETVYVRHNDQLEADQPIDELFVNDEVECRIAWRSPVVERWIVLKTEAASVPPRKTLKTMHEVD